MSGSSPRLPVAGTLGVVLRVALRASFVKEVPRDGKQVGSGIGILRPVVGFAAALLLIVIATGTASAEFVLLAPHKNSLRFPKGKEPMTVEPMPEWQQLGFFATGDVCHDARLQMAEGYKRASTAYKTEIEELTALLPERLRHSSTDSWSEADRKVWGDTKKRSVDAFYDYAEQLSYVWMSLLGKCIPAASLTIKVPNSRDEDE